MTDNPEPWRRRWRLPVPSGPSTKLRAVPSTVEGRLEPEVQRHLFSDCPQLPAAFPDAGQRLPQLLVSDVQIALRRLDVGVSEHQLDDADVDAIGQHPAGALVPQIVP